MESFVSKNLKHFNHKLKSMSANMLLSKTVMLMNAKLTKSTFYVLKISNKRFCQPWANLGT